MQEIKASGQPLSLAKFMEMGLMHPQYGYYSTKEQIFNKGGDFTTSPEISQMFGEMIAIWFMTALRNYQSLEEQQAEKLPQLNSLNIVEIGPGSGLMMSDILRTLSQFTGNLKNVHINMIEASPNLIRKQQDRLLQDLQDRMNIFMTYDLDQHQQQEKQNKQSEQFGQEQSINIERFYNKDQNFSISWFPSLKEYYNAYIQTQVASLKEINHQIQNKKGGNKQAQIEEAKARQSTKNPCFILAHELFDALPIHQFEYSNAGQWCERVVQLSQDQQDLELVTEQVPNENVMKVLKPDRLFKDSNNEIKPGDRIEICPQAVKMIQEIGAIIEVSKGVSLIVDYGEDHAFQNSFRVIYFGLNLEFQQGIKEHKLVKDFKEIADNVGKIDLTSYVNFSQLKGVAKANKNMIAEGPMAQGLFLECMGITMRLEILQNNAKTEAQKKLLYDSYERLCEPNQMGGTYKMLYIGHKEVDEVYPFLGESTANKENYFG